MWCCISTLLQSSCMIHCNATNHPAMHCELSFTVLAPKFPSVYHTAFCPVKKTWPHISKQVKCKYMYMYVHKHMEYVHTSHSCKGWVNVQGVVVSIQSIECGLGLKGLLLSSGIWSSIRNAHDWLLARVCMCKNNTEFDLR